MRFNRRGEFNVPFGHKPDRFRAGYITKIVNQIQRFRDISTRLDWQFIVQDYKTTISNGTSADVIYADPPYFGRHADYFNRWDGGDESTLSGLLQQTPARFLLSTWHHNMYRHNPSMRLYDDERFHTRLVEHFYHVGSTEQHRSSMTEALISNYPLPDTPAEIALEQLTFF